MRYIDMSTSRPYAPSVYRIQRSWAVVRNHVAAFDAALAAAPALRPRLLSAPATRLALARTPQEDEGVATSCPSPGGCAPPPVVAPGVGGGDWPLPLSTCCGCCGLFLWLPSNRSCRSPEGACPTHVGGSTHLPAGPSLQQQSGPTRPLGSGRAGAAAAAVASAPGGAAAATPAVLPPWDPPGLDAAAAPAPPAAAIS